MRIRGGLTVLLFGLALLLTAPSTFGQGDWTASLTFDPFPSPYISDWENNPAIGQAFITNGTSSTVKVRVYLTLFHDTRGKLASANSSLFEFPPGQPTSLTTRDLIDDSSIDYDHSIREISVRTGRLPEGKYRICLRLENESGQILLDNQCAEFTIVYPDPPYLVYPSNGESVVTPYPILQWTPVQVPIGFQVHYDLQIAEMIEGQSPAQALTANYPQYRNTNTTSTSQQYPFDALPLQKGKSYAWQVQVLDDRGYPPSANNGRSEIWTFLCDVDTTTPIVYRHLSGRVSDSATGASLGGARVVYRPVKRNISGNDTSWTDESDSLVYLTEDDGSFRFDSAVDRSFFSLTAERAVFKDAGNTGHLLESPDNTMTLDGWQHVAASWDGTTFRLYRNYSLVASNVLGALTVQASNAPLYIGTDGALGEYFNGYIDAVMIFNKVLSVDDMRKQSQRGCCVGVTGNFNADEGEIVGLADLSMLIQYLKGFPVYSPCFEEADLDKSGAIALSDLSKLISYLKNQPAHWEMPPCP